MTNESAPSSSKKWLSTDTRSTRRTSARSSAKTLSRPVVALLPRSSIIRNVDSGIARLNDVHLYGCSGAHARSRKLETEQCGSHYFPDPVGKQRSPSHYPMLEVMCGSASAWANPSPSRRAHVH